jgi:ABC-type phosphate transport system permease subunit
MSKYIYKCKNKENKMKDRTYQILITLCLFLICISFIIISNLLIKNQEKEIKVVLTCPSIPSVTTEAIPQVKTTNKTKSYFTIGSTKEELIEVMVKPTDKLNGKNFKEIWFYNEARVFLNDDVVYDYDDENDVLKVKEEAHKEN